MSKTEQPDFVSEVGVEYCECRAACSHQPAYYWRKTGRILTTEELEQYFAALR